jgi:hypothetical protein
MSDLNLLKNFKEGAYYKLYSSLRWTHAMSSAAKAGSLTLEGTSNIYYHWTKNLLDDNLVDMAEGVTQNVCA